ncbi:hypothetical protein EI94DRAFT_1706734 [Lactarius quietus]|nr:hypothetical protein EI94DRAFT_1706734 [Lactarius quietus]
MAAGDDRGSDRHRLGRSQKYVYAATMYGRTYHRPAAFSMGNRLCVSVRETCLATPYVLSAALARIAARWRVLEIFAVLTPLEVVLEKVSEFGSVQESEEPDDVGSLVLMSYLARVEYNGGSKTSRDKIQKRFGYYSTQIAQSQGMPSQIRVEVTVLRADNLPKIAKRFRLKNQFFVTVSDQVSTQKTGNVSIKEQTAQWDKKFDAFFVQPSSHLIFCLYAKRLAHPDKLIGTHEIPIPVESRSDSPFVLSSNGGQVGESVQPVTLYLTITVSWNATSRPILPTSATATEVDASPMEQATVHTIADDLATMSPAKHALHVADKVTQAISLASTWEGAVERIKWVMDTVSPVAGLNPYAQMAFDLVLAIPKVHRFLSPLGGNADAVLICSLDTPRTVSK